MNSRTSWFCSSRKYSATVRAVSATHLGATLGDYIFLLFLAFSVEEAGANETVQLSPALAALAGRERYLAFALHGQRYNIGVQYGLFLAQLALILKGDDREEVLAQMVELLALRGRPA